MSQPVLIHSRYKPARGGHAPGDLRNAFLEAIEAYRSWNDGEPEPTIEVREHPVTLARLCGLLWNCSDTMPGIEQRELESLLPGRWIGDDRRGTLNTYAMAARALRECIDRAHAATAA